MADGNQQAKINVTIPFDASGLGQVFGQFGQQPGQQPGQGAGPLRADLLPQVSPNITETPQALGQAPAPAPAPTIAPSANLPPPRAQAAQAPQQQASQVPQNPEREALIEQLQNQFRQGQEQRQGTIGALQGALGQAEAQGPEIVQAIGKSLANFSDAFFSSNISKNIKAPETNKERDARLNALRRAISQEQGALNKSEVDALKSALAATDNQRLLQSLGRDRRFNKSLDKAFEFNFRQRRQSLAKELNKAGIPSLEITFAEIDGIVPGGLEKYDGSQIAGIGGTESIKTPNLLTDQGRNNRRIALSLGNQILKARSGAQINEQEAARIMKELGFDVTLSNNGKIISTTFTGTQSSTDFVNGAIQAKDAIDAYKDTLRLGFGQDVFDEVSPALRLSIERRKKARTGPAAAPATGLTPEQETEALLKKARGN